MKLFDLFFPVECIECHQLGVYLCPRCRKKLEVHPAICPLCHRLSEDGQLCLDCHADHKSYLDGMIVGFRYEEMAKQLILQLKYHHKHGIADLLAEQLAWHMDSHPILKQCNKSNTVLSYIPSHFRRRIWVKGYNQSQLLAEHLGALLGIPVMQLTEKTRHTKRQARLSREKRLTNLSGSFSWKKDSEIEEKIEHLILVDDVTTTGSTLQEVAKVVKSKHPSLKVWGVVVARHG